MKPNQNNCKGCPHLTHNLHFPTGHQRLFCCLAAKNLNRLKTCPREKLKITQEANRIRETTR